MSDYAENATLVLKVDSAEANRKLDEFADHSQQLVRAAKSATVAVATIFTGSVFFSRVKSLINDFASFGDKFSKMSQRTGVAASKLTELSFVASQCGTSIEALEAGFVYMNRAIHQLDEESKTAIEGFEALGVSLEDLNQMSTEEQFKTLATAIGNIQDQTERTARVIQVFGKSGLGLVPIFEAGADGIDELCQKARDLGIVLDEEDYTAAVDVTDAFDSFQQAVKAVKNTLVATVVPTFTKFFNTLAYGLGTVSNFIREHKALYALFSRSTMAVASIMAISGAFTAVKSAFATFSAIRGILIAEARKHTLEEQGNTTAVVANTAAWEANTAAKVRNAALGIAGAAGATSSIPSIVAPGAGAAVQAANAAGTAVVQAAKKGNILVRTLGKIGTGAKSLALGLGGSFLNAGRMVGGTLGGILLSLTKFAAAIMKGAALILVVGSAFAFLGDVFKKFMEGFNKTATALNSAKDLWKGFLGGLDSLFGGFVKGFKAAEGAVAKFKYIFDQGIVGTLKTGWKYLKETGIKMLDFFGIIDAIKDFFYSKPIFDKFTGMDDRKREQWKYEREQRQIEKENRKKAQEAEKSRIRYELGDLQKDWKEATEVVENSKAMFGLSSFERSKVTLENAGASWKTAGDRLREVKENKDKKYSGEEYQAAIRDASERFVDMMDAISDFFDEGRSKAEEYRQKVAEKNRLNSEWLTFVQTLPYDMLPSNNYAQMKKREIEISAMQTKVDDSSRAKAAIGSSTSEIEDLQKEYENLSEVEKAGTHGQMLLERIEKAKGLQYEVDQAEKEVRELAEKIPEGETEEEHKQRLEEATARLEEKRKRLAEAQANALTDADEQSLNMDLLHAKQEQQRLEKQILRDEEERTEKLRERDDTLRKQLDSYQETAYLSGLDDMFNEARSRGDRYGQAAALSQKYSYYSGQYEELNQKIAGFDERQANIDQMTAEIDDINQRIAAGETLNQETADRYEQLVRDRDREEDNLSADQQEAYRKRFELENEMRNLSKTKIEGGAPKSKAGAPPSALEAGTAAANAVLGRVYDGTQRTIARNTKTLVEYCHWIGNMLNMKNDREVQAGWDFNRSWTMVVTD